MSGLSKLYRLLFLLFLSLLFKGCDFAGQTIAGYFFLISRTEAGRGSPVLIEAGGDIEKINAWKKQGLKMFGGRLLLDSLEIRFDSSSINKKVDYSAMLMSKVELRRTDSNLQRSYTSKFSYAGSTGLFGKNIRWQLGGNSKTGISGFDVTVYSPAVIYLNNPKNEKLSTAGFDIGWNADTTNTAGVKITIYKLTGGGRFRADPSNIIWQSGYVKETGIFAPGKSVLQKLPEKGHIIIMIERKTEKTISKGMNQKFYIVCASYCSGLYEVESGRLAQK